MNVPIHKAMDEMCTAALKEAAELRAENERLLAVVGRMQNALARIVSWEPATQELTMANDMAAEARNALDPE